jgi:predicted ATP-dependent serine protease
MSHDEETHAMSGAARLVRMANQIGIFFESKPHEEGVVGVADHINKFWEPRMRRQFFEMLDAGGEGMRPIVIEASALIRRPAPVSPEDGPHRAPMAERNLPQG